MVSFSIGNSRYIKKIPMRYYSFLMFHNCHKGACITMWTRFWAILTLLSLCRLLLNTYIDVINYALRSFEHAPFLQRGLYTTPNLSWFLVNCTIFKNGAKKYILVILIKGRIVMCGVEDHKFFSIRLFFAQILMNLF